MKKYLLPEGGKFYKANLHCHTSMSDAKYTPEEIKQEYMEKGYSIVGYTDHNVLVDRSHLSDENFLALNGFEWDVASPNEEKVCHIGLIALEPDNLTQICYHRTKYSKKAAEYWRCAIKIDESLPDFERVYSAECINEVMKTGRENGFYVIYNHPTWSMENYSEYMNYEHMHAMEICNYGCVVAGYPEFNQHVYDDMLRGGKRIFCISADDNHNWNPKGSACEDAFGGFTFIKAENLEYKTITDALLAGNFYASQGPEIHRLWVEDGVVHITCCDAREIEFVTGDRRCLLVRAEKGESVNSASFEVKPTDIYVRINVIDHDGNMAHTNAYFVEDLI